MRLTSPTFGYIWRFATLDAIHVRKNLSHELHGLALIFCTQSVKIGEIRGKIVLGIARFNCKSAKAATTDYASLN